MKTKLYSSKNALSYLYRAIFSASITAASFAAFASSVTPDNATFCDSHFNGKAKGLCIAYCKATSCYLQFSNDSQTQPNANEAACLSLLAEFQSEGSDQDVTNVDYKLCKDKCPCGTLSPESLTLINDNGELRSCYKTSPLKSYSINFDGSTLTCSNYQAFQTWNSTFQNATVGQANACVDQLRNLSTQCSALSYY